MKLFEITSKPADQLNEGSAIKLSTNRYGSGEKHVEVLSSSEKMTFRFNAVTDLTVARSFSQGDSVWELYDKVFRTPLSKIAEDQKWDLAKYKEAMSDHRVSDIIAATMDAGNESDHPVLQEIEKICDHFVTIMKAKCLEYTHETDARIEEEMIKARDEVVKLMGGK